MNLFNNLSENITYIKTQLTDCSDVYFKEISICHKELYVVWVNGMVNNAILIDTVFQNLINLDLLDDNLLSRIMSRLPFSNMKLEESLDDAIKNILCGCVALLFEGYCITFNLTDYERRSINPPQVEASIRGPKDSFSENLETNISLLRRRLTRPDFKTKFMSLGKNNSSKICVAYITSIIDNAVLEELYKRLNTLNSYDLLDISYIEELIEDNPNSIFPTVQSTERPDKVTSSLLDGKIALLQENSPFVIILPSFFNDFLQSPEDYYNKYFLGSFFRIIRYLGLFITIYLPSIYIALTNFNPELIPTKLLLKLQIHRQGVPFPTIFEISLMIFAFELIREAGLRLPKAIGPTTGIVGGLILGDAAVKAGIVSPNIIIIVAFTGISSFIIPSVNLYPSIIFLRIVSMLASSMFGFWGIFFVFLLSMSHLMLLRSFGFLYFYPVFPLFSDKSNDSLFRPPLWKLKKISFATFCKKYSRIIERNHKR